jgi:putative membrane protein
LRGKNLFMKRTVKEYFVIGLKGIAMGAADVVPGVSGGTIAFISGIYQELIETINDVNFDALKTLKNKGLKSFWQAINGNFLAALLAGIGLSVVSLAQLIKWLLENKPIMVWSFFFGLVLASIFFVGKQVSKWNLKHILILLIGAFGAYYITILPSLGAHVSPWFMFISGALAICAMILPGISGSFILVLLGAYKPVLEALHTRDLKTIFILISGAVVGLLTFSRLLKWMFDYHKEATLAVLTGFIIGSLNKIWPWKQVVQSEMIEGKLKVILDKSISPFNYQGDNQLMIAVFLAFIGFALIIILEKTAQTKV